MSRVGIVISFERKTTEEGARVSRAKVDAGGGDTVFVDHYADPGDDSCPLPGDYAALEDSAGTGVEQTAGYLDPITTPAAGPGERRLYSRSSPGEIAAQIFLKADGSIAITNADGGSMSMAADGTVTINGVTIDAAGNISTPGDVTAISGATPVSLATHVHTSAAPGSPTTGPIPAP